MTNFIEIEKTRYYCPCCGARFDYPEEKSVTELHPYGMTYAEETLVWDVCPECGEESFEECDDDYVHFTEPEYVERQYYAGRRYTIYKTEGGYELCFAHATIGDRIRDDTVIATGTLNELKTRIDKTIGDLIQIDYNWRTKREQYYRNAELHSKRA